ncbi:MAG: hypothetical protein WCB04_11405, partial [Mycobacteriales bacterium]
AAAAEASSAVQTPGAMDAVAHLSFGDFPGRDYTQQLIADHHIHGWDLAKAIGVDDPLDPELTEFVAQWWSAFEADYRAAGAVGERPSGARTDTAQDRLLVAFGRSPDWAPAAAGG